jgi:hypothetical protein
MVTSPLTETSTDQLGNRVGEGGEGGTPRAPTPFCCHGFSSILDICSCEICLLVTF